MNIEPAGVESIDRPSHSQVFDEEVLGGFTFYFPGVGAVMMNINRKTRLPSSVFNHDR
jgi:hypothetical protein